MAGFDDIPEAAYFAPPLTAVRRDVGEPGRRALELLVRGADRRKSCPRPGAGVRVEKNDGTTALEDRAGFHQQ
ncbi:substrate-binding domain-containing protein [Streptomyces sp. H27-H1]|uniref:substrate-binding domain-containing protein n=1 Tax=Streptomyces sp. H27-H1 TaxID=2996461 RepID=UPI003B6336FB